MRRLACAWLGLLAGCDQLLNLGNITPHDASIDAAFARQIINDPGGDFDGDGEPNATDLCPTIPNNVLGGMTDSDGDHVGDLCDPHPNSPGDCLLLFDDFGDASTFASTWMGNGNSIQLMSNGSGGNVLQFDSTAEEIVSLREAISIEAITVVGFVQAGDQGPTPTRAAVEAFVDLVIDTQQQANGISCAIESNGPGSTTVELLTTFGGMDTKMFSAPIATTLRVGAGTTFDLRWSPNVATSVNAPAGCRAYVYTAPPGDTNFVAGTKLPASQTVAIRGIGVGLYIMAVAGWGRCP